MIDFDNIDDWSPKLAAMLRPHISKSIEQKVAKAMPQYIEDARDLLFNFSSRDAVIDATLVWIRSTSIFGYHGSRLTDAEVTAVRDVGLLPLKAEARRQRLLRALSRHPKWNEVEAQLDPVIKSYGNNGTAGHRENQVHLTLSKAGLTNSFNHYLTHGAEFDQYVAHALLGQDGLDLLAHDGQPRLIRVEVSGLVALDAAHPYSSIDDIRNRGDVPNLVDEFIKAWSYRLANPQFQSQTLKIDCGMVFCSTVPAAWIKGIDTLVV